MKVGALHYTVHRLYFRRQNKKQTNKQTNIKQPLIVIIRIRTERRTCKDLLVKSSQLRA